MTKVFQMPSHMQENKEGLHKQMVEAIAVKAKLWLNAQISLLDGGL